MDESDCTAIHEVMEQQTVTHLEALGRFVLSVNEQSRQQMSKHTLLFMAYCEAGLYDNLVQAN